MSQSLEGFLVDFGLRTQGLTSGSEDEATMWNLCLYIWNILTIP